MPARRTGSSHASVPGAILGTLGYMSPEQMQGRRPTRGRTCSRLGCVLPEMLSGKRPFQRDTGADSMAAVLRDAPLLPSHCGVSVPAELEAGPRPLSREGSGRGAFQSAQDLAEALRAPLADGARRVRSRAAASHSVAVLPFLNLGAEPENEFFADGITEDVIAHLSKVRSLKVISRSVGDGVQEARARACARSARQLGRGDAYSRERAARGQPRAHRRAAHRRRDATSTSGPRPTIAS